MKLTTFRKSYNSQDTFDPGAPGQDSIAFRWVRRTLEQTGRTFYLKRPAFRAYGRYLIALFSDAAALNNFPPLTPEEKATLIAEFRLVAPEEQALENPADGGPLE